VILPRRVEILILAQECNAPWGESRLAVSSGRQSRDADSGVSFVAHIQAN
jgi:hypothetical protein